MLYAAGLLYLAFLILIFVIELNNKQDLKSNKGFYLINPSDKGQNNSNFINNNNDLSYIDSFSKDSSSVFMSPPGTSWMYDMDEMLAGSKPSDDDDVIGDIIYHQEVMNSCEEDDYLFVMEQIANEELGVADEEMYEDIDFDEI